MDLSTLLNLLRQAGPVLAKAPEFIKVYEAASQLLHPADQVTAKAALADIQADNDEGHRRLQAKLAAAARR
jgi:hypothetical protein